MNANPATASAQRESLPDRTADSRRRAETAAGLGAVGAGAYGAEKLHTQHEAEHDPNNTTTGHTQRPRVSYLSTPSILLSLF